LRLAGGGLIIRGHMNAYQDELDAPYALTPAQVAQFRADGFIKLKGVFSATVLEHYGREITRITMERNQLKDVPMEQRGTYAKAFIQVTNLWRDSAMAKTFSFNRRTARIACQLLGTRGVRMWHDQALYKEPGGGFTPWHADQYYWPMATAKCVTAWIPLQAVTMELGPLCFGKGSHRKRIGGDIAIGDKSEELIRQEVKRQGLVEVQEPFELGEVSFHLGWTLHRAGSNATTQPRRVHTIIYMDSEMRLAEPKNPDQQNDWNAWTPGTKIGQIMADERNPVLFEGRPEPSN
jgi:ectoine hydroxylase-related dioxygenase (phytanoyl-CoA dioxygenase family)